jgi:5-methylcytosine-specific restriction protein A
MAKPRQVCNVRGCPALATAKGRCNAHAVEAWAGRTWADNPWSTPEGQRLRRLVIKEEPNCRLCGSPTTAVDHIVARARGGTHDRSNLRGLCTPCRRAKDAKDATEGRRSARS